jgi:hypothetical protein
MLVIELHTFYRIAVSQDVERLFYFVCVWNACSYWGESALG